MQIFVCLFNRRLNYIFLTRIFVDNRKCSTNFVTSSLKKNCSETLKFEKMQLLLRKMIGHLLAYLACFRRLNYLKNHPYFDTVPLWLCENHLKLLIPNNTPPRIGKPPQHSSKHLNRGTSAKTTLVHSPNGKPPNFYCLNKHTGSFEVTYASIIMFYAPLSGKIESRASFSPINAKFMGYPFQVNDFRCFQGTF